MSVLWADELADCPIIPQRDKEMQLLLIEEDEVIAAGVKSILEGINFNVDIAYNGKSGLHMVMEGHYTLIIMDLMLPVQDSWIICEAIRSQGRNLPILMLNARDETEAQTQDPESGVNTYLRKPFDPCELQGRIRAQL